LKSASQIHSGLVESGERLLLSLISRAAYATAPRQPGFSARNG
jgi:hypothetical protein